jgi:long-chain acyl-CoA synthetase
MERVHVHAFIPPRCPVLEGYGQTECTAAATISSANDVKSFGHVGAPLPCNEIKLVSVEDMGYRYDDKYHGRVADDVGAPVSSGCVAWWCCA